MDAFSNLKADGFVRLAGKFSNYTLSPPSAGVMRFREG